jgi:hypothetical protein
MLYAALLAAPLLTACYVTPEHRSPSYDRSPDYDYGYVVAPALPVVVELGVEPYYYHNGFYYYYTSDRRWSYSNARTGPWRVLPPDRHPREIRFKGRDGRYRDYQDWDREREHDHDRDRDWDRDRDRDGRDYRR